MGILEDILSRLTNIEAALSGGAAPDKPAAGKPAAGKGKTKLKDTDLTALVTPMVQDEALVPKIKQVFSEFGIARLGEAKPEQYDALYAALTAVKEEADAGGDDGDDLLG